MKRLTILVFAIISIQYTFSQKRYVDFEDDNWQIINGRIVNYLGREAFCGYGVLKDIEFENGIIEVDIAVTGERSYPGFIFRQQTRLNKERFYIRPHRAGLYDDALQYVPTINGVDAWQIYYGPGYTASYNKKENEWIHFKIEINANRAQVFINDNSIPDLDIYKLEHGISKGLIGLLGPLDSTAFFSNFCYIQDTVINFKDVPIKVGNQNIISDWLISQPIKFNTIECFTKYPSKEILNNLNWNIGSSDERGMVDVTKFIFPEERPYIIYAKSIINSDKKKLQRITFGYSDIIYLYINGKIVFSGNNSYKSRDSGYFGTVGLKDAVYLPLEKGDNEVFIILKDVFGGWGFTFQLEDDNPYNNQPLKKVWQSNKDFKVPETVIYDQNNNCLYISNYDGYRFSNNKELQSISKICIKDFSIEKDWIKGFNNPMGMAILEDVLYVVEGKALVKVNIPGRTIEERKEFKNLGMLNDIAIKDGNIMLSDFKKSIIYKLENNKLINWYSSKDLINPNGIEFFNNDLYVVTNNDHSIKKINIQSKELSLVKKFEEGLLDGIEIDKKGRIYVSLNEGHLFSLSYDEPNQHLLNFSLESSIANFELIEDLGYIVIPGFTENNITIFKLDENLKGYKNK